MNKETLITALAHLSRIAPSTRPILPILSNVLVEPSPGKLTLTAFDGVVGHTTTVEGEHNLPNAFCLPCKLAESIISRLSGELALSQDDSVLLIESLSGRYEINTLPADDFPALPETEDPCEVTLAADELLSAIGKVLFACSGDESKQVLTGAHLTLEGSALEVAATDGHRLAVHKAFLDGSLSSKIEATIPAKALSSLMKIVEAAQEPEIKVLLNAVHATFTIGADVFVTRLLEGQYPNYGQLIPKDFSREYNCDRKALMEALERIQVLADQKNNIVDLTFDGGILTVGADATEVGSGRETLTFEGNNDGFSLSFNVAYLLQGLKQLKSTTVAIYCNKPTSPVVLRDAPETEFLYLVMPVQKRS